MPTISADMVRELRERTDAGLMDCKKALAEAQGDMDKAVELLRKSGLAKLAKRAGKATTEGRILAHVDGAVAVLVEVCCETDFVSRGERFGDFARGVLERVVRDLDATGDVTALVQEREQASLGELVSQIGENVAVRRVVRWAPEGVCHAYLHGGGRIGVLVDVVGAQHEDFGHKLALHIAAANPAYLAPEAVPAAAIAKEKEIAAAQPDMAGKPANVIDKIVEGRLRKWCSEVCLTKQLWIHDQALTVDKVDPKARIARYVRWQLGEAL